MIYEHCSSLTFFSVVPLQVIPFKHIRFTSFCHRVLILSKTKVSVNILILLFYICPP